MNRTYKNLDRNVQLEVKFVRNSYFVPIFNYLRTVSPPSNLQMMFQEKCCTARLQNSALRSRLTYQDLDSGCDATVVGA